MSYSDALARMNEIRDRLGFEPNVRRIGPGGFDQVLATARSSFVSGPPRIDTPSQIVPADEWPPSVLPNVVSGTAVVPRTRGLTAELSRMIERASAEFDVPKQLITAVARAESGFRSDAGSPAGAQGLMQLMPATARGLGVTNILDPWQNLRGGTKYLRQMLDRYDGDVRTALAAYNAGPGNIDRYGGIPPFTETRNYVAKVLRYAGEFGWKP